MAGQITPLLSVVTPISRMAGKLENLSSWINQEAAKNLEIILVHDVQDEFTGPELRNLLNSVNNRTTLLETFAGSPGEARNVGLRIATGDWVAFWDSDDRPNIKAVLECLGSNKIEFEQIIGGFTWVSEITGARQSSHKLNMKLENALVTVGINPGIWRMLFKRALIGDTEFLPLKMAEDQVFIAEILAKNPRICVSDADMYSYYFGLPGHLIDNKKAKLDLLETFMVCGSLFCLNLPHANDSLGTILIRQFVTIQKYLPIKCKFTAVRYLIKILIKSRFRLLKTAIIILVRLHKNRNQTRDQ